MAVSQSIPFDRYVPREEAEWFMRNGMSRYGVDTRDVNESRNMIRLRADIHRCFDTRMFSIIPKPEFASDDPDTLSPGRNIARPRKDDVSLADSDDEWYEETVEFEEGRGRKRIRRECSSTLL
ncbi:hypothetical protein K4K57_011735 [Colletotrichum sp. SAR 10_99]|nr:hypothetical protein K4K57_011735 [Colletotrichum sp. SAR 10_99]